MTVRAATAALLFLVTLLPLFTAHADDPLPDSLRIVVLGSSTAAGAGASPRDSAWVWRYQSHLQSLNPAYEVHNLAVGGYTSYHIQADGYSPPEGRTNPDTLHNITKALTFRPHAIIINLPSNDAALNFSIIEQSQNFERLAEIAANASVALWVCTTQPRNLGEAQRQNLITMRDWLRDRFGERCLDFWNDLATEGGKLLPAFDSGDGVHLNNSGHYLAFARARDARIPEEIARTTAIADLPYPQDLRMTIYPQPAADMVNIRIEDAQSGTLTVVVTDLLGREMTRLEQFTSAGSSHHRLNVGRLPRGMYHVIVRSGERVSNGRLVLAR